jgi:YegS/Rv2252/BmrU family lipid kinase
VRVAVIVNPVAGVRGTLERARRRAERAHEVLTSASVEPEILITERGGHARELALGAVERGARIVVAWGGDGTVNEVASALAFGPAALGVIPAGSGNGLARMFRIPSDPDRALTQMLHAADRRIDLGEVNGRLFVNVAGVGFDAHVAERFAALERSRRGFLRYAAIVARELGRYQASAYAVTLDGRAQHPRRAFLVSFANGRQWGNGAVIAPAAATDDGVLDAVIVDARSLAGTIGALPRLFAGSVDRLRGVQIVQVKTAEVAAQGDRLICHVDGEPVQAGAVARVRIHPGSLRVRM